jgi:hypothetical protein
MSSAGYQCLVAGNLYNAIAIFVLINLLADKKDVDIV